MTQNALHIVLVHLCRELDVPPNKIGHKADDDSKDDVQVFEEMII